MYVCMYTRKATENIPLTEISCKCTQVIILLFHERRARDERLTLFVYLNRQRNLVW